jgi:L-Ala-D/L-Glu epimerase
LTLIVRADFREEIWPIKGSFVIARGAKTEAKVISVTLGTSTQTGRGEGVPYARYNETVPEALEKLSGQRTKIEGELSHDRIAAMPLPFAARNALDCALWDLKAKQSDSPVWHLAKLQKPTQTTTAFTISLASPDDMASAAHLNAHMPLLKLKLGAAGDTERMKAVRRAVPGHRLIVDANEGWPTTDLKHLLNVAAGEGIELVEQPLREQDDAMLADIDHPVAICADESAHGEKDLMRLMGRYDAVNVKLDKTGGLTPAIEMCRTAKSMGLKIMVGCMVSTSLSMAPALHLAEFADWIDLDGPLLLTRDCDHGLAYERGLLSPPDPALWG